MLLETIKALIQAGGDALQTTCGLSVTASHVSLVQQGTLTFPALGELHIRNGSVQVVHLGCDTSLVGHLVEMVGQSGSESGIEVLAQCFLEHLLEQMGGRNPRGVVTNLGAAPVTLTTRGLRTFGFRLESAAGQLFLLAEIPAKGELENAKFGDYKTSMVASYLPSDWRQRDALTSRGVIDAFLVFLRKVEQDVYFEVSGPDGVAVLHPGFMVGTGTVDGRRALKFCTDLAAIDLAAPGRGDLVRAQTGVEDRSLTFRMELLGTCSHTVAHAELPCVWFGVPEALTIAQRRQSFRLPLSRPIRIDIELDNGGAEVSPWADHDESPILICGRLQDISFSGARIVLDEGSPNRGLDAGSRVICRLHLEDATEALRVNSVIRRSTIGLADRNAWQRELGVEFVTAAEDDRDALEQIRRYVLSLQRSQLSQRIQVASVHQW